MTAQNLVPRRDDAILKSYEMYKQAFENCGDPASFGHSLSILDEFVAQEAGREEPRVRCTALDFRVREDGSRPAFRATESTGPAGVEGFLSGLASAPRAAVGSDRLDEASFLIVENLCPETVVKLGLTLRVPPQFWSEYVENRPWFWRRRVAPQWLTLPSVQAAQGFTKTQWVVPRPFRWKLEDGGREEDAASAEADALLWVKTDRRTSRVHRVAGIMRPRTVEGELMASVAFIRETLMVWMSRDNHTDGRLVGKPRPRPSPRPESLIQTVVQGLILVDPPFQAKGVQFAAPHAPIAQADRALPSEIQRWVGCDKSWQLRLYWGAETLLPPTSIRAPLVSILARELSASVERRVQVLHNPFAALHGLYQAVASEWLLVDEYVGRELETIAFVLEHGAQKLHTLQAFLQDLFAMKRRWSRYTELAQDALRQCEEHGRPLWRPTTKSDTTSTSNATTPPSLVVQDFQHVLSRLTRTRVRIESNIAVLLALVSISEAEQALADGQGITRLTRVAAVFLPFSAIAAIMAIPKEYLGPGGAGFWIYWLVSIVVMVASLWLAGGTAAANARAVGRRVRTRWKGQRAARRKGRVVV
jgi:hypothetical protein